MTTSDTEVGISMFRWHCGRTGYWCGFRLCRFANSCRPVAGNGGVAVEIEAVEIIGDAKGAALSQAGNASMVEAEGAGVSQRDPQMHFARQLQLLESLRVDLVSEVAEVLRDVHQGGEAELARSLGRLVATSYLLGQEMGISCTGLDREVREALVTRASEDSGLEDKITAVHRRFSL